MFERLKLVCVSRDEYVNIELSLQDRQALHVSPGHHLVAMAQTNAELTHGDNFLLGVVQILAGDR